MSLTLYIFVFSELDFNKDKVDLDVLNWYLSHRLVISRSEMKQGAPIPIKALTTDFKKPGVSLDGLLEKFGGDQREVDPDAIDRELHNGTKILMDDEHVIMAFRAGRDVSLL